MTTVVQEITVLEVLLRMSAILTLAVASGFIWSLARSRRIRPLPLWVYVGVITSATLIWRVVGLFFVFETDAATDLDDWIIPVTSAMYVLNGVSLLLLAYASSRGRRSDGG